MKKTLFCAASALFLFAASCKEHGVPISLTDDQSLDSTYVGPAEAPQPKRVLIEELSGATCPNCPQGAEKLEEMLTQNPNAMSVVTIHAGTLSSPVKDKGKQNFRTTDGEDMLKSVWGGEDGGKPSAIFDRLKIGSTPFRYFVTGYLSWSGKLTEAKNMHPTSPVKLSIASKYNDTKDQYEIEAVVKYTSAVTDQQALHIFLTEDKIIDAQEFSNTKIEENFEFNHVFRKAITPPLIGKPFLTNLDSKEAGRVYVYRPTFKIDKTDAKQKFWVPENMKLVVFVTNVDGGDSRVVQVQEGKLVP